VESGSRAWGFPSPDSDYDVRFIYVRPREDYLRLDKRRDVVEYPIDEVLDISGWDLDKTLRLLHASNPTLFEWSQSPIVYKATEQFQACLPTIWTYFAAKSGLWHYLSTAEGNYRGCLKGERVRAKKYFYVLRPLLACRWILERGTPPPMRFAELVETQLDRPLRPVVEELLRCKMSAPEVGEVPRVDVLNVFIEENLVALRTKIEALPREKQREWGPLNDMFLSALA
ncbi:MAG TPA: nucleotidyltransferase domain-containing protein, partial [Pseudoflavonifractor sp.]|nr:nucleotidyltransferase domain-containing protein [Pseudoflavonifractor sp.]